MTPLEPWARALEAFNAGIAAALMNGNPHHYLSIDGNKVARAFQAWVEQWATGTVLDVGCGPQPVPLYLSGLDLTLVTGIDPLPAEHPFRFVAGKVEEYDGEADTVICATSLDHFEDVCAAAAAMRRIAQQRIILWHCGNAPTPPNEHTWHVTDDDVLTLFTAPLARDGDFYVFQR